MTNFPIKSNEEMSAIASAAAGIVEPMPVEPTTAEPAATGPEPAPDLAGVQ